MIKVKEFKNSKVEAIEEFIVNEGIEKENIIAFPRYFDSAKSSDIMTLMYFKEEEPEEEGEDGVTVVVDDTTGNVNVT